MPTILAFWLLALLERTQELLAMAGSGAPADASFIPPPIVVCSSCGTKNRVPKGRRGSPRCGQCGNRLSEHHVDAVFGRARPNWKIAFAVVAGAAAASLIVFELYINLPKTYVAAVIPTQSFPVRVPVSRGIVKDLSGENPTVSLTLVTPAGRDYLITFEEAQSGRQLVFVYVPGGDNLTIKIPPGTYKVTYDRGVIWYGLADKFGLDDELYASDKIFDFGNEHTYSIDLNKFVGGNLWFYAVPRNQTPSAH